MEGLEVGILVHGRRIPRKIRSVVTHAAEKRAGRGAVRLKASLFEIALNHGARGSNFETHIRKRHRHGGFRLGGGRHVVIEHRHNGQVIGHDRVAELRLRIHQQDSRET